MTRTRSLRQWALIAFVAALAGAAGYVYQTWRLGVQQVHEASEQAGVEKLIAASLPDLEGRARSLTEWRGRVVVVNFWATWCAPCREEIPLFVQLQNELGPRGVQFIGIAIDRPELVKPYAAELRMNYPVLISSLDGIELSRAVGNRAAVLPYTIVIDRQGRVAAKEVGAAGVKRLGTLLASLI